MKNYNILENQTTRRSLFTTGLTALAMAFTVSLSQPVHADDVTPPPVPDNIQVPAGNEAFLKGFAVGTQNYICLPSGSGFAWTFFGPQATLFDDNDKQIITHFLSSNPDENGTPRPTWQHSKDTSTVWAMLHLPSASVPQFGAIPWLLLRVVGDQGGPTDGDKLTETTFIQRLNTSGGVAPSTGCTMSTDVGKKTLVDYEADYFFYKAVASDEDDD